MKKRLLLIAICSIFFTNQAQDISYGLILGTNSYDVEAKDGSLFSGVKNTYGINFGIFGDYNFTKKLGLKTDLFYTSNEEGFRIRSTPINFVNKVGYIQLAPKLKFSVSSDYQKGFYVLIGPRVSFLLSAKDEDNDKINDFYKSSHFGLQFGLGTIFLKHIAIELTIDYGLNDTSKVESETRNYGGFLNLNVNLESLINN